LVSIASYFGYQNWQLKQQISQIQPTPQPKANQPLAGTPEDPTTNWKTINISADPSFGLMEYQIKIPATWEQISHSSNFQNTETFQNNPTTITYQLIIDQEKNLNSQTGKPYSSLREFTGLNYDVSTKTVAGQTAALVQPRAGSETNYMVLFFSPYGKQTVSIKLDTPRDGSKIDEGRQLFDQILSTFKFANSKSEIPNNQPPRGRANGV